MLGGMKQLALLLFLFILSCNVSAADRELSFARDMMEDAVIRNDVEGIALARARLVRIAAETGDRTVERDARYLAAVSSMFELFSGSLDLPAAAKLMTVAVRQADRVVEIDPKFADGWMISAMLRGSAQRAGIAVPKDPEGAPNRFAHAIELDAKSPGVAFFAGVIRSSNPLGAAPPEGVQMFDDLVARLDADRAATGRRFGLWDAQARAWQIFVRMAQDEPRADTMRTMAARLMELRPDFAQGQDLVGYVTERCFVAAPAVTWKPFLTDAVGDGKSPKNPDVIAVDRAEDGDRWWYRVAFHDPLPPSFGVNIVVNRSGDPATGMKWWGNGSTARFDRLVTAWITRSGDRYFGRAGVTDDPGSRGARLTKISSDIQLAIADDNRSVMIGVPKSALELTDASTIVVAGGTHLVWNDDAASAANSR
ncbi:MAG: hypothetical protein DMF56_02255 [Acidobacteria bacterium]|nr:MAG: hypothetical protein DMF56_02255 [Acidobacteriota bacterium]